jgi:hypothetical protein
MKTIILTMAAILLTGCVPKTVAITTPNNTIGYVVSCGGQIAQCYSKASKQCTNGYTLIKEGTWMTSTYAGMSEPQYNLVIECK